MKLEIIQADHIKDSARLIDKQGIPKENVWSQYYVIVKGKEYPFKHLVRTAYALVSEEKLLFQSNDSYRNYIEDLGFKFTYYEGGYNFFTQEELAFYSSLVNSDYRSSNPDHQYYGQKLYPIIAKVKYWAEQLLIDGFKLKKDGSWLNGHVARIKPYFWPRIYSGEDKDVFFNVEVNGAEMFIGYKLDGYFETKKALPKHKLEVLENYRSQNELKWPQIPFDRLDGYDWDKLLSESRKYVNDYLPHHNQLKRILSKETKIARITWNTNQWVNPSGRNGKSTNPSFEFTHGFGHEEWLFDGDKVIEGYKYGFLEPIHKHRSTYEGKVFDLSLYTRNGETSENYWVTTLKNVEIISSTEAKEVSNQYRKEGWYDDMKVDLYNLNLNSRHLDEWIKEDPAQFFNIKFDATQINQIQSEPIPVLDEHDIPSNRYALLDISYSTQRKYEEKIQTGFSFDDTGSKEAVLNEKGRRKSCKNEIELEYKHNLLQQKFLKYLQIKYGKSIVKRECRAFGASRIDVTQKTAPGKYIFYEVKTYNSLKSSIREGIGQLLEYCLYPNVEEAEKIVLVSHVSPSEEQKVYLNHIKNYLKIPFSYIHFDIEKEEVLSEI